jgi:hypothetical protein
LEKNRKIYGYDRFEVQLHPIICLSLAGALPVKEKDGTLRRDSGKNVIRYQHLRRGRVTDSACFLNLFSSRAFL